LDKIAKMPLPRLQQKPRPKGFSNLKKKRKKAHMASGAVKTEAEAPSMASVLNRGQKL